MYKSVLSVCRRLFIFLGIISFAWTFIACTDEASGVGAEMMPGTDNVAVLSETFRIATASIAVDSVLANTSMSYLGRITDSETNVTTAANFLAQFYLLDDYSLPPESAIVKNEEGKIEADSVDIRLYIHSFYGDSLNAMKLGVYELDTVNVLKENDHFYTNLSVGAYLNPSTDAIRKELTFAVADLAVEESYRASSSYSKNIRIQLPRSYGTFILNSYYRNPAYFQNSYNFLRHVCPGFYFKTLSGNGTMFNIDVSALSVYFRYAAGDTTYTGIQRVAATGEVIQTPYIENRNIRSLLEETDYTFLTSPAGIFTEAILPVDSIYRGAHGTDTINSAKVVFSRYNNTAPNSYSLPTPATVLLVRKSDLFTFFDEKKVADSRTSYLANYDKGANAYTFSNIASLIAHLHRLRDEGAGVTSAMSLSEKQTRYQAWEVLNPEWNKVVLVPVTSIHNASGSLISVQNDLSLSSTRLVGGNTPVSLSVVYTRFQQ